MELGPLLGFLKKKYVQFRSCFRCLKLIKFKSEIPLKIIFVIISGFDETIKQKSQKKQFFCKRRSFSPNFSQSIKEDLQINYLCHKMYIIARLADCIKDMLSRLYIAFSSLPKRKRDPRTGSKISYFRKFLPQFSPGGNNSKNCSENFLVAAKIKMIFF